MGLAKKLFIYTGSVLLALLLVTFGLLEMRQTRLWRQYLQEQHLSAARFATPEILKRFRGDFHRLPAQQAGDALGTLSFSPDLMRFELYSTSGHPLFVSSIFPGFSAQDLPAATPLDAAENTLKYRVTADMNGRPVLDVSVPAFSPSGTRLLTVRFYYSYRSVEQLLAEMHRDYVTIAVGAALVSLLLAALVARRLTRPLNQLTEGARAITRGELETRIPLRGADELTILASAFNEMASSLGTSRAALTQRNQQLTQANEELLRIYERLTRAERLAAVGQVAAGVSHEIDNPVGIILGYAQLILEDLPPDDALRDDIQAIIDECLRCKRITGGLLSLSRTGARQWEALDLKELVEATWASLQPQKLFRSMTFDLVVESEVPRLIGDADRLRQVLVNLLLNAAQMLTDNGQIRITLAKQNTYAELLVDDNGPGIAGEQKSKVFEPFYSTKEKGKGTGLGLAICRKLIEEHGGQIEVLDSPLGGARFKMTLPCDLEQIPELEA